MTLNKCKGVSKCGPNTTQSTQGYEDRMIQGNLVVKTNRARYAAISTTIMVGTEHATNKKKEEM